MSDTPSTDLQGIMRRDERRRRMLNDPDLHGDTLLLALALDEVITTRRENGRRRGFNRSEWVQEVEVLARGPRPDGVRGRWVKHVIGDDVPRYEAPNTRGSVTCAAPMIRREGLCGKYAGSSMLDHDPQTGEARRVGWCSRHRSMAAGFEARRQAWIANGSPTPGPNTGGVLARYFATDWAQLYQWAAPWRTPLAGAREATPPRPTLRLIRGGEAGGGA